MRGSRIYVFVAVLLVAVFVIGRLAVGFYTEQLWFAQVGYVSVFWTRFATLLFTRLGAGILTALIVLLNLWFVTRQLGPVQVRRRYGNIEISEQIPRRLVQIGMLIAAILAGWWLSDVKFGRGMSINVLTWLHRADWGVRDPLFGRDLSFYVFTLPFYNQVLELLMLIALWSLVLSMMSYVLVGTVRFREQKLEMDGNARLHALILLAALLILIGMRVWIGRYGLLLHGTGFNNGIGYTDVHARLPAQRVMAILCMLTGGALIYSALTRTWAVAFLAAGLLVVSGIAGGVLYPSFVQKFRVEPQEYRFEQPYIGWNIDFTRRAYGLDRINKATYDYHQTATQSSELTKRLVDVPVWDLEPLETSYNQLQVIFGYYHFNDVDYDRYSTPIGTKQVAISVREFVPTGLTENARTWLNLHFDPKYIRGVGAVVTPAAATTDTSGEPPMWLSNLNPIQRSPDAPEQLNLTDPSIYFGELMDDYVVVRKTTGLVAPKTAIPLNSISRVVAFSWRFADKNLLFTGGLTDGASLAFRRRVGDRVRAIAPFIAWDADPYPVVSGGHVVWIIDGYSATAMFPLAQAVNIQGIGDIRYLHNTVKATIDAATGEVRLYRFDDKDPITATYASAFPSLFAPASAMPADLQQHVRYPGLLLHQQAEIYGHYHLNTPEAFYRAEDLWQLPQTTDASQPNGTPFRSVYQMMLLPGETHDEFVLAAPYLARQRNNMTALLIARNDVPHYGELVSLELPRNQLIPGPAQVHAIVEQDPNISPQLSLWRQAGSDVNIGHVRIVPIGSSFLYVMPLFLSAQGSPIPELQRIIVSDGTHVAMTHTLAEGVNAVFGASIPAPETRDTRTAPGSVPTTTTATAPSKRALELLDAADRALRAGDFATFGARLAELRKFLQQSSPR